MDAKELRIGNNIFNGVITEIGSDYFKFNDGYSTWNSRDMVDGAIESITLTEDWLRRCGFISRSPETPHAIWDAPDNIKISMIVFLNPPERTEYRTGATTGGAKCNTVHQLQNLFFALTGEELTITQ